jgi:23S rRNA (guanosine2251-2'-O)-methyltransferase
MTKKQNSRHPPDSNHLWIWGIHACYAALANPKRRCFRLLMNEAIARDAPTPEERSCKIDIVDSPTLSRFLPEGAVHQGIAMEVAPLPEISLASIEHQETGVVVILDQVTDPHNVGAILRTARALKALGIIMTERNSPPLSGVLAKAASGALELLPVWKVTNLARTLDELKEKGFWTVGLAEGAPKILSKTDLPPKLALIMGSEGEGLRRLTQEKCDFIAKLPTDPHFSTLNVSIATALALYELVRV